MKKKSHLALRKRRVNNRKSYLHFSISSARNAETEIDNARAFLWNTLVKYGVKPKHGAPLDHRIDEVRRLLVRQATTIANLHAKLAGTLDETATAPYVDRAAILGKDGRAYSLPRPARHTHVLRHLKELGNMEPISGERGFLLSNGAFVDRTGAMLVARKRGQVLDPSTTHTELYTEDLW